MKKVAMMVVGLTMAAYVGVGAWLYVTQDGMVFPRTVNAIQAPDFDKPAGLSYLTLHVDGAELNGLGFNMEPPEDAEVSSTLVLAFGGNAHDVTGMVRFLHETVFPSPSVAVAGYSYRGYPNALNRPSTGVPTQKALEADALNIYDDAVIRVNPAHVVVIGYSLGTAVGTYLATQRKVDALVLAAPFASIRRIAEARYGAYYPVDWMVKHPFDTAAILPSVEASVTVVYTDADGLIPADHVDVLRAAKPEAAFVPLLPPVGHGDVLDHPEIPVLFRGASGI